MAWKKLPDRVNLGRATRVIALIVRSPCPSQSRRLTQSYFFAQSLQQRPKSTNILWAGVHLQLQVQHQVSKHMLSKNSRELSSGKRVAPRISTFCHLHFGDHGLVRQTILAVLRWLISRSPKWKKVESWNRKIRGDSFSAISCKVRSVHAYLQIFTRELV